MLQILCCVWPWKFPSSDVDFFSFFVKTFCETKTIWTKKQTNKNKNQKKKQNKKKQERNRKHPQQRTSMTREGCLIVLCRRTQFSLPYGLCKPVCVIFVIWHVLFFLLFWGWFCCLFVCLLGVFVCLFVCLFSYSLYFCAHTVVLVCLQFLFSFIPLLLMCLWSWVPIF